MTANHTPHREDIRYTNSISEAMLEQAPRGASLLLWAGALFIVLALVWTNWAELDEIARGDGEIIPSHQLQIVQNLEGGIVSEILVREGQLVERGEVLLRIEDKRFASSFRENQVRELELSARAARLRAEANEEAFIKPQDFSAEYINLIEQELRLFESRQRELNSNLQV